jgi:hypothetical protein
LPPLERSQAPVGKRGQNDARYHISRFRLSRGSGAESEQGDRSTTLLDKIGRALDTAGVESKAVRNYSKGILLLAKGDDRSALVAFAAGVKAPDRDFPNT